MPKRQALVKKNKSFKKSKSFKKRSTVKLAILSLAVLLSLIVLAKIIQFIQSLNQPLSPELLSSREYHWDKVSSINIIFKDSSVSLLHFNPTKETAVILKIPDDTYIEVPKGYGSWKVASIYELGQAEKKPSGARLLKESLASLLGLPIDGFITFKDTKSKRELKDFVASLSGNPLNSFLYLRDIKTDLTPVEAYNLFIKLASVRADKLETLDLEQSTITRSKLLSDSTRVLGIDIVNLDLFIREKMADSQILQEGLDVAIFNATNHSGLAQQLARIVTNLGGDVIATQNVDFSLTETIVAGEGKSITLNRVAQIFAPQCLRVNCSIEKSKINFSRAQINIIVGEDYFKKSDKP